MNERNVAALAALLYDTDPDREMWSRASYREMAEALAVRGVLVPSALTDDEATQSPPFDGEWLSISHQDRVDAATRHRAALERIAKGEP